MSHSHHGAKDFLWGALVGGILGVAAVSVARSGKKKNSPLHGIRETITHVGKAISSKGETNLAEILDFTVEGIELWKKLKKRK